MPFAEFITRLMPLIESHDEYSAAFPPSTWKRIYDTGVTGPSGELRFDAQRISEDLLGGEKLYDVATPFVRELNAALPDSDQGSSDTSPQAPEASELTDSAIDVWTAGAPVDSDDEGAAPGPVSPAASEESDATTDDTPADLTRPRMVPAPGGEEEPQEDPTEAAGPTWAFPVYDFSREDIATPLPPVRVSILSTGTLRYTWDDPGEGEVFRVSTSDTDVPFNPEDPREAAVTRSNYVEDSEPLTTSIRFITVWAYEVLDAEEGILGQARRIAEGIYIRPLEAWEVTYEGREQTVYAGWRAPVFPPQVRGVIRTAKLPVGESAGRYLRNQSWLSSQFAVPNNGFGFQDASLEPGQRHTYIAAIEVEVEGSTRLSVPEYREVTPVAEPDRIQDVELETVTLNRVEQLRLTWTQRRGTRVTFYRSNTPADPEAVARGLIDADLLPRAGLTDDLRVRNIPHPTGEPAGEGREQWALESLYWPEGTDWDTVHLIPVTEADSGRVMIGKPVQRRRAGRVEGITVVQRMNWQLVTFTWPGDAIAVELRIGPLNSETSLDSPPYLTVEKQEYERNGGFRIDWGLPPQGCRLFVSAITHFEGRRIASEPTVAAVEPLWGFTYTVQWPGNRTGRRSELFSRAVELFGQSAAEIQISAAFGACPEHELPHLTLVHNTERLPLHANDGRRIDLFLERPGGQVPPEPVTYVVAPAAGRRSVWFDYSEHGSGWYRLLVDAPPAASLPPLERRSALERYALADPSLELLWRR